MEISSSDDSIEDDEDVSEEEEEEEEMSVEVAVKVMKHFESIRLPYGKPKTETLTNLTYGIRAGVSLLDESSKTYGMVCEEFVRVFLAPSLERITENVYFTQEERQLATNVLVSSAALFIRLNRHGLVIPPEFTAALAADATVPFYRGKPSYMNPRRFENGTGSATRRNVLKILSSNGVLEAMLSILIDEKWCGARLAGKILYTFVHATNERILKEEAALNVANKFMNRMSTLSEDDTKLRIKANQISLTRPFYALEKLCGGIGNQISSTFWLTHVDLKYYMNENVTERLFALGEFSWWGTKRADHQDAGMGTHWITNERYISWLRQNKILETLFERNRVEEELIKKGTSLLEYVANMRMKRISGACPDELLWTMWKTASELGTKSKYVMVLRALAKVLAILGPRVIGEMLSRDEFQDSMKIKSCRERAQKLLLLLHNSSNTKRGDSVLQGEEVSTKLVWRIIWSSEGGESVSVAMLRLLGDLTRGNEVMVTTYASFCVDAMIRNSNSFLAVKVLSILLTHLRPRTTLARTVLRTMRNKIAKKFTFLELLKSELNGNDEDVECRLNLIRQAVRDVVIYCIASVGSRIARRSLSLSLSLSLDVGA